MSQNYEVEFDKVILKQLNKISKNKEVENILRKMFDKIELLGPLAGELLDGQTGLYEIKNNRPPIRLYFEFDIETEKITIFEYEMKTSPKKQKKTIKKLRRKSKS